MLARLTRQVTGREIDLMLGTSNPWLLIAAQVVPIAFASTIGFYSKAVWLFYLTIFSVVAGGIACQAAERSRVLWLRGNWSRGELFLQVERSFWRHNSFVMGALIALMVGIGSYAELPVSLLAVGLPLLMLSTVLSTYLGLMVTRGMRLAEGVLAVIVMLALMAVAVVAARANGETHDILIVASIEVVMAVAAIVLRSVAKARWENIDWMLCRPDRAFRTRAAS
jgi:general stress protein CsbA